MKKPPCTTTTYGDLGSKPEFTHEEETHYTGKDAFGCLGLFVAVAAVLVWLVIEYVDLYY